MASTCAQSVQRWWNTAGSWPSLAHKKKKWWAIRYYCLHFKDGLQQIGFHVQVHASLFNSFWARYCRFSSPCLETLKNEWLTGFVWHSMAGEHSGRLSGSRHRPRCSLNPPNLAPILWCVLFQIIPGSRYVVGCNVTLVVIQKTKNFLFVKWNVMMPNTLDVLLISWLLTCPNTRLNFFFSISFVRLQQQRSTRKHPRMHQ